MLKQADATWVHAIAAGTGATRRQLPHWIDHLPPCNAACPAGENIQAWLEHARAGQWQQAWKQILDDNPFPAVHGRACYHPCQSKCNRGELDSAVGIHAVERLVGDVARKEKWQPSCGEPTGRRVLIVGAGPAGLSCAYHLARLGHAVEVREATEEPRPGVAFSSSAPVPLASHAPTTWLDSATPLRFAKRPKNPAA